MKPSAHRRRGSTCPACAIQVGLLVVEGFLPVPPKASRFATGNLSGPRISSSSGDAHGDRPPWHQWSTAQWLLHLNDEQLRRPQPPPGHGHAHVGGRPKDFVRTALRFTLDDPALAALVADAWVSCGYALSQCKC